MKSARRRRNALHGVSGEAPRSGETDSVRMNPSPRGRDPFRPFRRGRRTDRHGRALEPFSARSRFGMKSASSSIPTPSKRVPCGSRDGAGRVGAAGADSPGRVSAMADKAGRNRLRPYESDSTRGARAAPQGLSVGSRPVSRSGARRGSRSRACGPPGRRRFHTSCDNGASGRRPRPQT